MPIPVINDQVQFTNDRLNPIEGSGHVISCAFQPSLSVVKGEVVAQITSASVNEVQTISDSATVSGGTFTLTLFGKTTAALAYNISNANLEAAIEALLVEAGIVGGTVAVAGSGLPGNDTTITYGGTLAGFNVPLPTIDNSLITGGGSLGIVQTTAGRTQYQWGKYDDGDSTGLQVAKGLAQYAFTTDESGRVSFATASAGGLAGEKYDSAPVYTSGRFKTSELTGLDANAVADLGRLESGVLADGVLLISGS